MPKYTSSALVLFMKDLAEDYFCTTRHPSEVDLSEIRSFLSEQKQGQDRKVSENATQVRPTAAHYSDSFRPTKRHFSQLLLYDSADNCDPSFSADFYFKERVENTRIK